jgi:hypothetical protein
MDPVPAKSSRHLGIFYSAPFSWWSLTFPPLWARGTVLVKKPFVTEAIENMELVLLPSKIRHREVGLHMYHPLLVCQAFQALGDSVARVEATEKPILIICQIQVFPFALGHPLGSGGLA